MNILNRLKNHVWFVGTSKAGMTSQFLLPVLIFLTYKEENKNRFISLRIFNPLNPNWKGVFASENTKELERKLELNTIFERIVVETKPISLSEIKEKGLSEAIPTAPQIVNLVSEGLKKVKLPKWMYPDELKKLKPEKITNLSVDFRLEDRENGFEIQVGNRKGKVKFPFAPAVVFESNKLTVVVSKTGNDTYLFSLFPQGINFSLRRYGDGFVPVCVNAV